MKIYFFAFALAFGVWWFVEKQLSRRGKVSRLRRDIAMICGILAALGWFLLLMQAP